MFNDVAWTIIFSLLCSLVVAAALVPVLTSKFVNKASVGEKSGIWYGIDRAFNNFFDKLDEKYANGVAFVLHHKALSIILLVLLR